MADYPPAEGEAEHRYPADQQPEYDGQVDQAANAANAGPGGRKKRAYAGQAYEFGAGGNAALGGQQVGGQGYPAQDPSYGGYGHQPHQQPGHQQPGYSGGYPQGTPPTYGQQGQAVGGYQAPEPGYPPQGSAPQSPGVAGITQGMNNMGMGAQSQGQPMAMHGRPQLNQLYPNDLLNQPLNVADLDLPPPPIILPQNVSVRQPLNLTAANGNHSRVLPLHHMRIARPSMSARP